MSSLESLVHDQPLVRLDRGSAVVVAQAALQAAGFRLGEMKDGIPTFDGIFGDGTFRAVERFQAQHGLKVDGKIGIETAKVLDVPHADLIAAATPAMVVKTIAVPGPNATGSARITLPHDDTASLIAFYGNPDASDFDSRLVGVTPPFPLTYEGKLWPHAIQFHNKCAPLFDGVFKRLWEIASHDPKHPILRRVSRYSGGHVNRPVRGSSRKSTHAFAASMDFDAEELPMGVRVKADIMPSGLIETFLEFGLFWGGNYIGRPDPMHVQAAHE